MSEENFKFCLKLMVDGRCWQMWTVFGGHNAWEKFEQFAVFDEELLILYRVERGVTYELAKKSKDRTDLIV